MRPRFLYQKASVFRQNSIFNNSYANIFGYTFFEVATGSMSNTIEIGDVVIVKITKEVQENEIIVYSEDNNFYEREYNLTKEIMGVEDFRESVNFYIGIRQ